MELDSEEKNILFGAMVSEIERLHDHLADWKGNGMIGHQTPEAIAHAVDFYTERIEKFKKIAEKLCPGVTWTK